MQRRWYHASVCRSIAHELGISFEADDFAARAAHVIADLKEAKRQVDEADQFLARSHPHD